MNRLHSAVSGYDANEPASSTYLHGAGHNYIDLIGDDGTVIRLSQIAASVLVKSLRDWFQGTSDKVDIYCRGVGYGCVDNEAERRMRHRRNR